MVGKLMKHELKGILKILLIIGGVAIVLAAVGRLFLETDPQGYLGILFTFLSLYLAIALWLAAFGISIAQFSRSLFSGEGYMTFSLPVTPTQLLIAKLLSAIISMFVGVIVSILAIIIIFSGFDPAVLEQIFDAFGNLFEVLGPMINSEPLIAVEVILLLIVSVPMTILFIYAVESVGQLFTKNRKLFTLLLCIGLWVVVLPILSEYCLTPILEAASRVSVHLTLWVAILLSAGIDVGCFFLTKYILSNKINLVV